MVAADNIDGPFGNVLLGNYQYSGHFDFRPVND